MEFSYFTNEYDALDLINSTFNTNASKEKFILSDNQKLLLLKNDNEVIGTCLITLKNNPINNTKTYYLDYICIKENYRGKGLGRKLFKEVEQIAKNENVNYLELTSNKNRESARKMYLSEKMTIKDTDIFFKEL